MSNSSEIRTFPRIVPRAEDVPVSSISRRLGTSNFGQIRGRIAYHMLPAGDRLGLLICALHT